MTRQPIASRPPRRRLRGAHNPAREPWMTTHTPNTLAHFSVNADDMERARTFYERVFGWRSEPWGPPGFYLLKTPAGGVEGAVQQRRDIVPGARLNGLECTIAVAD